MVLFLKVAKRATGPKPVTYEEDVSRISSVELFRLTGKRLQ